MNRAIDNPRAALLGSRRMLVLVAATSALFETGCASTTAMRASAGAFAGSLWDRPRTVPVYDLYAENMARGKDPAPATPMLASSDSTEAEPQVAAAPSEPSSPHSRTDESVRITLGRPESVPVLKDSQTTPPAELALAEPARAPKPKTKPKAKQVDPEQQLRAILEEAGERLEAMATYQVNITRTERVGSQVQPEEAVLLSVRRKPKAVRLEWPDGASKGREVIYSTTINDKAMFVNMANSALPIPRMTIPIDSVLATRNSRHSIAEAGFDTIINDLTGQLATADAASPADRKLVYKGIEKPKDMSQSCHLIQRTTPTKDVWKVYLDVDSLMPVVVTAHREDGELLERYAYSKLQANPEQLASADAFDPDKRWGEAKGLFSRMAKAVSDAPSGSPTTTR